MNLQEQISRMKSMMGVISETNFFRRRVAPSEISKYFPTFAQETFDQFDVKNYKDFKYNLVIRILEYIMWRDFEIGWEDLPEQDEINYVNTVSKMYNDEIEKLYNDTKRFQAELKELNEKINFIFKSNSRIFEIIGISEFGLLSLKDEIGNKLECDIGELKWLLD